jgi:hypothetical protein
MSVEIIVAFVIWIAITLSAPAKLRIFFGLLSGGFIFLILAFSLLSPKKDLFVTIPPSNGKPSYKIPFEEFQVLIQDSPTEGLIVLPEIDTLKAMDKSVFTADDLSQEQLKVLESQTAYSAFVNKEKGLIIRHIEASIQNGQITPALDVVEFSNLPLLDPLNNKKQELLKKQKALDKTKTDLHRKQKVLDAIREIVDEPKRAGNGS